MADRTILGVENSTLGRRWVLRANDSAIDELVQRVPRLSRFEAALLAGRGVPADETAHYLNPTLRTEMPDPSVLTDMDKAVGEILDAMNDGKRIVVFSDYDVDGGTSAAQMIRWGRGLDFEFGLHVPDRIRDGYGPSKKAFEMLKGQGADLVITLDCGAAAHDALEGAAEIGLPVIVVDHHLMDGIPPALALINPNRPDDQSDLGYLAAAGVTFLLIVALQREAKRRGMNPSLDLLELLGLTALGTVCDVVPMRGLNRAYVKQGLKVMDRQRIAGLRALSEVASAAPPFTSYHAGFVLGPRINAGGRIGRSELGAQLLSEDSFENSMPYAQELEQLNIDRRQMQDQILREALQMAETQDNRAVIVCASRNWHPGIIGIVAGRLKDQFERPAIIIGIEDGGTAKGSGRSIRGVDLGTALTKARQEGLLSSGGGHAMAGGLSLSEADIPAFTDWINDTLGRAVAAARKMPTTDVDALLAPSAISLETLDQIDAIGPYGPQNPAPTIVIPDCRVAFAKRLKGGHIRFNLEGRGGDRVSGILFRGDETPLGERLMQAGETRLHCLGQLRRNRYQGRESVDFHLKDIADID